MRSSTVPFLLLLVILLVPRATAGDFQPSVKFLGDLRVRAEVDGRDFDLSTYPNTFTLLRTRLGVEALPVENIRVLLMARDSRIFGSEVDASGSFNTISNGKNLDLPQGYVEVSKFLADDLSVKLGRMELSYANERVIGAAGWSNIGRSFDGGLLRFDGGGASIDLFGMNVAETEVYPTVVSPSSVAASADEGQYLFGLYSRWKPPGDHVIDAYLLYQGDHQQLSGSFVDFRRTTVGAYAKGRLSAFVYEVEGGYQSGTRIAQDIAAYELTGSAGYEFEGMALSGIAAGVELLSGTPEGSAKYESFDPPFATTHKLHGFMDYFTNIPSQTGGKGLVDMLARASFRFSDAVTAGLWYHNFRLAEPGSGESLLGDEFDLTATWKYAASLSFELGASAFLPGPLMRDAYGGADTGYWGYLTTMVSF